MPQQISVPGVGQLEFPDGMSEQDMAAAIQKNFPQVGRPKGQVGKASTLRRIGQAAVAGEQAVVSGINAGGLDTLGLPMDAAVGAENILRSGLEAGYLGAGKLPPVALDPVRPATVPMTSDWLENQARRRLGTGSVDALSNSRTAKVLHGVSRFVGPGGAIAGYKLLTASGKVLRAIDKADALEQVAAKPHLAMTTRQVVPGKPHFRLLPAAQAQVRSAMHEMHQEAAPPALRTALAKAGQVPAMEKLEKATRELIQAVNPEKLGPDAKIAAAVTAGRIAERVSKTAGWHYQSLERMKFWQRGGIEQESARAEKFIDKFEQGLLAKAPPAGPDPKDAREAEDRQFALLAQKYKDWGAAIVKQDLKNGIEYTPEDHYLPHSFMDEKGVAAWMTKKYGAKWGDPSFMKDREFSLYTEAVKAGFTPKYHNPEEMMLARQGASDWAEMQVQLMRDLQKDGVASRKKVDPYSGGARRRAPNGDWYWVRPGAVAILHNAFDSQGLWGSESVVGSAYRGAMALKNAVVPVRLMASAFHPLHVIHIDNAAYAANAAKEMLAGKRSPVSALKEQLKSAALYRSFWENPQVGGRLRAAFDGKISKDQLNEADAQALQDMLEGGFVPDMSARYRVLADNSLQNALRQHQLSAIWKLPGALLHTLNKPLFEWWIPNLKAASYANEVRSWRLLNPEAADNQLQRQLAFRRIAKSVDNRYGEMNYETLFWKPIVKDLATLNTLSLGWQLGFLREFGGGAMDLGQFAFSEEGKLAQIAEGKLDRPLFAAQYLTTAALYGGLLTWAMTGQKPQGLKDYIYPAAGKNPDGSARRVSTMFYTREIAGLVDHMEKQGVVSGLAQLVRNKGSGIIGLIGQWATGLDDYGDQYRDPTSPVMTQLQQTLAYTLKSFEPISATAGKGQDTKGEVLAGLGFTPAPKYVTQTVTQARIADAFYKFAPRAKEVPYENVQKSDDLRQLRQLWDRDDPKADDLLEQVVDKYNLSGAETRRLVKQLNDGVSGDQHMFQELPWEVQKQLLDRMSPAEREEFLPYSNKTHLRDQYEPPTP